MNADRAPHPGPYGGRNRCAEMQGNVDCLSERFGRAVVGVQDKRFAFFFHFLDWFLRPFFPNRKVKATASSLTCSPLSCSVVLDTPHHPSA